MKRYINGILTSLLLITFISCAKLDLVPLDAPTSAPFTTTNQFREALNEGYREAFYIADISFNGMDDDMNYRQVTEEIKAGTMEAGSGRARNNWSDSYKGIARMLAVKEQILNQEGVLSENDAKVFLAEADFSVANFYSYLISHYGDVPYYESPLTTEEAFEVSRTDKATILENIYRLYDNAILNLPVTRNGLQYATKGAALGMKARIALYMGDHQTAAEAAQDCMDLGAYELHPDFADLFKSTTRSSKELIFYIPRDESKNVLDTRTEVIFLPRNRGGWGANAPTWSLLASYECIDGRPIDESPLFDPQNPFKNRDPRCNATIVPFGSVVDGDGLQPTDGSRFLDLEYTPHPERTTILDYATGLEIPNNDAKPATPFSSFTGLLFKKGIDNEWIDQRPDGNRILLRYADVLLMYAEAKIELNDIDPSVLKAINDVRDRAYTESGFPNPAITTTDQTELRRLIRRERRAELAFENLRYMDLIRWRLAEKVFNRPSYGLLTDGTLFTDNDGVITVKPSLWFWSQTPELDEDGIADFQPLVDTGFASILAEQNFPDRQYLFPIPIEETLLAPGLLPNNPGY